MWVVQTSPRLAALGRPLAEEAGVSVSEHTPLPEHEGGVVSLPPHPAHSNGRARPGCLIPDSGQAGCCVHRAPLLPLPFPSLQALALDGDSRCPRVSVEAAV